MSIKILCNNCHTNYELKDESAWKKAQCTKCKNIITIPQSDIKTEIISDNAPEKKIKIPVLLTTIVTVVNVISLLWFFIIFQSPLNILCFLLLIINSIIFIYVLKNKLWLVTIFWCFLLLVLPVALFFLLKLIFYQLSILEIMSLMLPYFLLLPFIFWNLRCLYKNIQWWIEKLPEKSVTDKNYKKRLSFVTIGAGVIIWIFNYGYYDIEKNITPIDESFFVTKYQNIDIADEDNLYIDLKALQSWDMPDQSIGYKKRSIIDCLYADECVWWGYYKNLILEIDLYYDHLNNMQQIEQKYLSDTQEWTQDELQYNYQRELNEERAQYKYELSLIQFETSERNINPRQEALVKFYLQQNIEVLYRFKPELENIDNIFLKWSKKPYYKVDITTSDIITGAWSRQMKLQRDYLIYKTIYYLNNDQEQKAIELLNAHMQVLWTMLEGDTEAFDYMLIQTGLWSLLTHIDLILDNFEISQESKATLALSLQREIDYRRWWDDSIKNAYKSRLKYFDYDQVENVILWKYEDHLLGQLVESLQYTDIKYLTMYTKSYSIRGYEEIWYNIIKNRWKVSDEMMQKYWKINFFKSNQFWQMLWSNAVDISYRHYQTSEKLNNLRIQIMEKLER